MRLTHSLQTWMQIMPHKRLASNNANRAIDTSSDECPRWVNFMIGLIVIIGMCLFALRSIIFLCS